jgi:sirohydrochlorin cobaltochelatase
MAGSPSPQGDVAPVRLAVVVDPALPATVREACRELARALAAETAQPVALLTGPRDGGPDLSAALAAVCPGPAAVVEPAAPPPPMGAAPFVWREDGRPDWGAMWTTFCELALFGGPPHRGPDAPLRAGAAAEPAWPAPDVLAELRRGIWETTGLFSEPARPGWLAVSCDSPRMAAWLCAVIILENVEARCDEERLLLPAEAGYELRDQVKSLVTVVAKAHHYWRAHLGGGEALPPGDGVAPP